MIAPHFIIRNSLFSCLTIQSDGGHVVTQRYTPMTLMSFVNCDLFNAYTCRSADKCFYKISQFSNPSFALGHAVFSGRPICSNILRPERIGGNSKRFRGRCTRNCTQYCRDNGRKRGLCRRRVKKKKGASAGSKKRGDGRKVKKRMKNPTSISGNGSTIRARNVTTL